MRPALASALVALTLVALLLAGGLAGPTAVGTDDGGEPTLVAVGDARVWPYVASEPTFDRRASSLNVVIAAEPDHVRRYLLREEAWNRSDEAWTDGESDADPSEDGVLDAETVPWRDAPGGTRYVYTADEGWQPERYQLHRGTYFGSRYHLRAYGLQNGEWTAIQAHAEHWDWFTITHTVDSVESAQRRVEAGFLGEPGFEVRRVHHDNGDTYDADGWTTVVLVALTPLLARRGVGSVRRQFRRLSTEENRRRVALAGSLAALPLVVRFGGVLFERHLAWLSPDAVVAVWYPVLVAGVPLAAYGFGRRLPAREAGALAAVGFGAGIVLDYAYLGIAVLPVPVAAHRAVVVAAVGLLAAGARSESGSDAGVDTKSSVRWTPSLRAGAALWLVAVVAGHLV